jgi:hypothetical protein
MVHLETGASGANRVAYSLSPDGGATWTVPVEPPGLNTDVDGEDLHEGAFMAASWDSEVALSAFWDQATGSNEVWIAGLEREPLLIPYCSSPPNSSGFEARLRVEGSHWLVDRDLTLIVEGLPDQPGLFFTGDLQSELTFGDGYLCTYHALRFLRPPRVPVGGTIRHEVDFEALNLVAGRVNFQFWFRDPAAGRTGYSGSSAYSVWLQ